MIDPFLKWPGGKRWLVSRYGHLFPAYYRRYLEPFLGAGAVFFYLCPKRAILSDTNAELVNVYRCLKDHASLIDERLAQLHNKHSKALYYQIRGMRPTNFIESTVRFLYLNRTCFNGIYRVNLKGEFNVPIGTKTLVEYPPGYLKSIADRFSGAQIHVAYFEETIDKTGADDFLYVDPPYTVMHNNNNFIKYNASLFPWSDQLRLAAAIKRALRRGAAIMISNADHESIQDLNCGFGYHHRVNRSSKLAGEALHRCKTTELLITSYKQKKANGEA